MLQEFWSVQRRGTSVFIPASNAFHFEQSTSLVFFFNSVDEIFADVIQRIAHILRYGIVCA